MKRDPRQPKPKSPNRSRPARVLLRLVRLSGWLGILLGAIAVGLDRGGVASSLLQRELTARLEVVGSTANFDELEIDWLGPGLTLHGFSVSKQECELIRAEHIYVAVGFTPKQGPYLARLDLDGGRLVIGEDLLADVSALLKLERRPSEGPPGDLQLPSVQVRDFAVEFEDPTREVLPLGRVDISLEAELDRPSKLTGRLVLPRRTGAPTSPEVYLSGLANPNGLVELHTTAHQLDLASWEIPRIPALALLQELRPQGQLSLHTNGSLHLRGDARARGQIRLALTGGSLVIPTAGASAESIEADIETIYRPEKHQGFWDPGAWAGVGRLHAELSEQAVKGGFRLGRASHPDHLFESWIHLPAFSLDIPELWALEEPELIPRLLQGTEPSGIIEAAVGIRSGPGWRPGRPLGPELEIALRLNPRGRLEGAYQGLPDPKKPGDIPLAFALPFHSYLGQVLFTHNSRFPRRELLNVNFVGAHDTGPAEIRYQEWTNPIDMPPFAPGYGEREWDLFVIVPGIDLDHRMREYLPGLDQIQPLRTLFEDYNLQGGRAAVTVHVAVRAESPAAPVRVDIDVADVRAAWFELPVPTTGLQGTVQIVDDGLGVGAVRFALSGEMEGSNGFELAGRQRFAARTDGSLKSDIVLDVIELHADGVELDGAAARIVGEKLPDVGEAVANFVPRGRADIDVVRSISGVGGKDRSWIEVTPIGAVTVEPKDFPMHTTDVRGRVIVELTGEPKADGAPGELEVSSVARIAPLLGTWAGEIPVGLDGVILTPGDARGALYGACARPGDEALITRVATALGLDPEEIREQRGGLAVTGAIDFDCKFVVPDEEAPESARYRFFLRENRLDQPEGLHVDALAGVLALEESLLTSAQLSARLGDTPVELINLDANIEENELRLGADLKAGDIAIDRTLLRQFLDPESVTGLLEDFSLRGRIDIDPGHLDLVLGSDQQLSFVLRGEGTLSDAYAELGLPLSVGSAQVTLEELIYENGTVRGWGRVHNLYGQVMERDLSGADLVLSYHGSRLTLETLKGSFCQGEIHGLTLEEGETLDWSGPVFSVDLESPFVFQAGLGLESVDAGLVLEDVFTTGLADRGRFSAKMRLQGQLQDLLSIRGRGQGSVHDTVLWSVPVLRDLFSQLGFDATAVFDSMRTDFQVEQGNVVMEDIEIHSPLLSLRGRGILGLDGTLNHDLEVKYSLVDKSGPLSGLIYLLQNTLLSVSIRGDMSRPKVFLNSALTGPFARVDDDWRALPLPGFSALPERF